MIWGNAACSLLKSRALKPGILLLEAVFVVETSGERWLEFCTSSCRLPPLRILVDPSHKDLSGQIAFEDFDKQLQKTRASTARKLVRTQQAAVGDMLKAAELHARQKMQAVQEQARQSFADTMNAELERLMALQKFNPNIRDKDIEALQGHIRLGTARLGKVQLRLDAVRLVCTA